MKRKQSMQTYGHLYKKIYPVMNDEVCQCCGEKVGLEWDHCPAITTAQLFVRNDKIRFILVLLCGECNRLLSNKLLPDFPSRFYFVKEALLERYKGDLLSECRDHMTTSLEGLLLADAKFHRLLDRIGFGLVKIDQLTEKHIAILNLETVSGVRIIDHLSERPGHGLLSGSNLVEDTEEEQEDEEDLVDEEEEYEEDDESEVSAAGKAASKRSTIPRIKKRPWLDFTTLDGFKVFLRNERIYTKNGYAAFLKNQPQIAERMNLPNQPDLFFKSDWQALTSNVSIVTQSGQKHSLDAIELYVTSDQIGTGIIRKRELEKLLDVLDITSREQYIELWSSLRVHSVDVIECLPEEPDIAYADWRLW